MRLSETKLRTIVRRILSEAHSISEAEDENIVGRDEWRQKSPEERKKIIGPGIQVVPDSVIESFREKVKSIRQEIPEFASDGRCAAKDVPLWVFTFGNFVFLREEPLVLRDPEYLEAIHRICDVARSRDPKTNLIIPNDTQKAQKLDTKYAENFEDVVGSNEKPFGGYWAPSDIFNTNPYMHIGMCLTNFSFNGPTGGPYTFYDKYDFNKMGSSKPPLGDTDYMLQYLGPLLGVKFSLMKKLIKMGPFSALEDLMRYYEATLNYGGFEIKGTTIKPGGDYVPPKPVEKKKK